MNCLLSPFHLNSKRFVYTEKHTVASAEQAVRRKTYFGKCRASRSYTKMGDSDEELTIHDLEDTHKQGDMRRTMLASALAGMLSRVPCHPIDTMKANAQLNTLESKSVLEIARQTYRRAGVRGMYRGFSIAFVGSAPATMLYLSAYESLRNHLMEGSGWLQHHPFVAHLLAGMGAELFSCILWVPIDVVKERLQIGIKYNSTWHAIQTIWRTEGIRGIYKGYGATFISFGPFSGIFFSVAELSKRRFAHALGATDTHNLPYACYLASGFMGGGVASFFTNPFDVVKLRMQVQRTVHTAAGRKHVGDSGEIAALDFKYRHVGHGLVQVARQEGIAGLWRGAMSRMLFHAPAAALTLGLHDSLKEYFTLNHFFEYR
eukprot:g35605.t1